MKDILTYPDERLRQKSIPLEPHEFGSNLKKLINEMYILMDASNGVGLAAPQIGIHLDLFVYKTIGENVEENSYLINPKIIKGQGEIICEEGCLSIPGVFANVKRFREVTVSSLSWEGENLEKTTNTFSSVIIQHEYDHLLGKLFIDHLSLTKKQFLLKKYRNN